MMVQIRVTELGNYNLKVVLKQHLINLFKLTTVN